ncbi:hypothetical protein ANN_22796 [Periplaneta americana]|uniref:RxLR effector candidate protein n=1 Tax=Periplaneta americana TaxID=6978 RepID=A0ABQ8SJD1_PERAM|nr:hypothetical protein ANN_22796 [Periplaneta americana]
MVKNSKIMFYLTTLATAEVISASPDVPEFCPAGVLLHASKSTDMSLSHLNTLKCHRLAPGSNPQSRAQKANAIPTEMRLRVFENKVLRKIFGAKRDEVRGEWRKLHNTELHALYSSPDIIRNIKSRYLRWAGHIARMGESRNACRVSDERSGILHAEQTSVVQLNMNKRGDQNKRVPPVQLRAIKLGSWSSAVLELGPNPGYRDYMIGFSNCRSHLTIANSTVAR